MKVGSPFPYDGRTGRLSAGCAYAIANRLSFTNVASGSARARFAWERPIRLISLRSASSRRNAASTQRLAMLSSSSYEIGLVC